MRLLPEISIKLKSQKKYINLKFSHLYDINDGYMFYYVYFYFSIHACKFYEFLYVKMRKNDVLRCFCEVIVVNEFWVSLVTLGMYFYMNSTVDKC